MQFKIDSRNKEIFVNVLKLIPAMFILFIGIIAYINISNEYQPLIFNHYPNMELALIILNLSVTVYLIIMSITFTTHKYAKDKNIKGERNACCTRENLTYLQTSNLFQCLSCKRIFET